MKITVTAKKNVIYDGKIYRGGESFEIDKTEAANMAKWLTANIATEEKSAAEGLPPLDAPKKAKKNV